MPPRKLIAHVTDAHLGQRLTFGDPAMAANKMAYVDDPTAHRDNLRIVLDDIAARDVDEVVFGGDIGAPASNPWFFDLMAGSTATLRVILGNHDTFGEVSKHYHGGADTAGGEMIAVRDEPGLRTLFMDSSSNAISDAQFDWLQRQLDTPSRIVVFVHHPVLPVDTPLDRAGAALRDRDRLRAALRAAGRDITLFCGHYHMEDDTTEGHVRQLLTPATSYQIDKNADGIAVDTDYFGYRLIAIDDAGIDSRVVLFRRGSDGHVTPSSDHNALF